MKSNAGWRVAAILRPHHPDRHIGASTELCTEEMRASSRQRERRARTISPPRTHMQNQKKNMAPLAGLLFAMSARRRNQASVMSMLMRLLAMSRTTLRRVSPKFIISRNLRIGKNRLLFDVSLEMSSPHIRL